ncbi:MAG: hypothetical protein KME23_12180 [Goleter apudmare HA4340-LM2]|jgi:hypothetical protein|nr:hypothetical protein [Goleter apudmare HA4340-LM2]
MTKVSENNLEPSQDIRLIATSKIWGFTVGILAVCIPLSAVTRSGAILPLAAIGGAAVGTVAVWRADQKKLQLTPVQQQRVELLEQRIANLETIVSSEELDLLKKIKELEFRESNQFTLPNNQAGN